MNRNEVLGYLAALRDGAPMVISPGLANYTLAESDHPLTIYNMDMPYATPLALGIALGWSERKVIAIEGDGSLLAGPGVLTTIARYHPENLIVVAFDNGAYLTTGSGKAPTATAFGTDIERMARAAGMTKAKTVAEIGKAKAALDEAFQKPGPWLIVAKVDKGDRPAQRVRTPLPVYVFEAGLRFHRAAVKERRRESP